MDIVKLLKTLNSAQSSWQITLAVVLGMISGFLPLATPINFLLIFIAFAINIPLGIFFLMSLLFATLGLLLDPVFAILGLEVLTYKPLNGIFTSMYNCTPTLWSSFNYTILMGSLLISIPLGLSMFPILNRLIDKYRDVLQAKFKDSKYFSWLNPYGEENLEKKPGLIRWWAAGLFISIVAILATLILFIIDPIIKVALEYYLSKVSHRTVQIDTVDSRLFKAQLEVHNISFIDNGSSTNSDINIDKLVLKLNTDHLLQKKIDFELISLGNITLMTSIAKEEKEPVLKEKTSTTKESKSSFDTPKLPKVEDLIAKEGLKSVAAAKEIQKGIEAITKKWSNLAKGDEQKKKIASIEKKIKALEISAANIKSIEKIPRILKDADILKKELEVAKDELAQLTKDYDKDKKTISEYLKEIQTLPMQDYYHLLSKYTLNQNGAMNIVGTYFSSSIEGYLRKATKYYAYIKPYISSEEEEVQAKRMQGRWVKFASAQPYPDFVIQKLNANIIINNNNYDLKIKDISNEQKVYKKPIKGLIKSISTDYKLISLDFEHNELGEDTLTSANSTVKAFKLSEYSPISQLSMKNSVIDGSSFLNITNFKSLDAKVSVEFVKTTLLYASSSSFTDKTIASILSNVTNFNIDASIGGTLDKPEVSINSDLDIKIAKGLTKQVGKEVQKYQKKLKVAINQEFKKQMDFLDLGEFNDVEKLLNSNTNVTKELQGFIEKNISKDAMQKYLGSKTLDSFRDTLKFF